MINKTIVKDKSELHLFIIWNNGFEYAEEILEVIRKCFLIKLDRIHTWSEDLFAQNLTRFYGKNLPANSAKAKEVGIGPFRILVVEDLEPVYAPRRIRNDAGHINVKAFDIKQYYRKKLNTNILHATNTEEEFRHDITLLLGMTPEELIEENFTVRCEKDPEFGMDLWGARGWKSVKEMLKCLNQSLNYLILRNYENYPDRIELGPHSDIDMLTDSMLQAALILNAVPTTKTRNRVQHRVAIGNSFVNVDIRYLGDGYYDSTWEKRMLENRQLHANGFYVMSDIDYVYSLAYHALIQKKAVAEDYVVRIRALQEKAGVERFDPADRETTARALNCFMEQNHYRITEPDDPSVVYNTANFGIKPSCKRTGRAYIKKLKRLIGKIIRHIPGAGKK